MTPAEVRARVAEISREASDWERAHKCEDDLYLNVLNAIAEGAPNAKELAREALVAHLIGFPRYVA